MRTDHTPYWLARWLDQGAALYAERYRFPHCESVGEGARLTNGRYVNFSGPGIHLGRYVHLYAMRDASIQISAWALGDLNPKIVIDDYCIVNPGVRVIAAERIEIGPGTQLATGAYLRLRHPWGVGIAVVAMAFLATALATTLLFLIRYPWPGS